MYLNADVAAAVVPLDQAIIACRSDDLPEIASLGLTLVRWRGDPQSPSHRCLERSDPRAELLHQAGQANRTRVLHAQELSATRAPLRWRSHMAPGRAGSRSSSEACQVARRRSARSTWPRSARSVGGGAGHLRRSRRDQSGHRDGLRRGLVAAVPNPLHGEFGVAGGERELADDRHAGSLHLRAARP